MKLKNTLILLAVVFCSNLASAQCKAEFEDSLDLYNGGSPFTQVFFSNKSTYTSNMSYLWDFDDGTKSNSRHPVHTYAKTGNYTVCLYLSDSVTKCKDSIC